MHPKFITNGFLIGSLLILWQFVSLLTAQQQYSEVSTYSCNGSDKTGPSPAFLYTCNGEKNSCQAYLTFRSLPNYDSAAAISNLTSSSLPELTGINNISASERLPLTYRVIVPVKCSCSGKYYQATTSYTIHTEYETYFSIANNTYEGLSTCNALRQENPFGETELTAGLKLRVPLRCACPTKNQTSEGIKFLLTYLVTWDDNPDYISHRFNATPASVAAANGFSLDQTIYPFTTVLVPLRNEPLNSQMQSEAHSHKESRNGIYIGIAIGISLGVLCCFLYLVFFRSKGGNVTRIRRRKESEHLTENSKQNITSFDLVLKIYGFEELEAATEGLSTQKKLSDSVYRGVLRGQSVAIKRTSRDVKKEVKILQTINHINLMSLYGVCEHRGVFYLVYEFMENGSLKQWINQKDNPENQSWNIRIRMALDVANGLDYLHNFTASGYVHKDINSSNILVNSDLRAKIVNFSLAKSHRLQEAGNSRSFSYSSSFLLKTNGYMAPEYLEAGKVTPEIDVYAFGVVLLELITGQDAIFMEDGHEVLLSEVALSVMSAANAGAAFGRLIDSNLQEKHPLGFIIDRSVLAFRLLELSVACLAVDPSERPSMAVVISRLLKIQLDVQNEYSFSSS